MLVLGALRSPSTGGMEGELLLSGVLPLFLIPRLWETVKEQHQGLELINNVVFASLGTVTRNSAIWQP